MCTFGPCSNCVSKRPAHLQPRSSSVSRRAALTAPDPCPLPCSGMGQAMGPCPQVQPSLSRLVGVVALGLTVPVAAWLLLRTYVALWPGGPVLGLHAAFCSATLRPIQPSMFHLSPSGIFLDCRLLLSYICEGHVSPLLRAWWKCRQHHGPCGFKPNVLWTVRL